jgi:hypothetical protein
MARDSPPVNRLARAKPVVFVRLDSHGGFADGMDSRKFNPLFPCLMKMMRIRLNLNFIAGREQTSRV